MVASINSAPGPDYYLEVDRALYYLAGDGGVGVWYGEAAKSYGYVGEIKEELFKLAFDGRAADGSSLVQRQQGKKRQEAWDVTFSAPKSVSVLWSVLGASDRHRIESFVLQAAQTAVDYLDENALITRRGKGGRLAENAMGFFALCPHATSRAQDPQLHIHALAFNMCLRGDGTTGSIRSHDLYLHKMAVGALFRVELAYLLQKELGLNVKQDGWSFEVAGVPKSLCEAFSKRRAEIEAIANEEGWSSAKVLAKLALVTRNTKEEVAVAQLIPRWRDEALRHGFGEEQARGLFGRSRYQDRNREETTREKFTAATLTKAINEVATSEAYFPERDIMRHVASEAQTRGLSACEIITTVKKACSLFEHRVDHSQSDYWQYTTKENVACERELLRRAEDGISSAKHLATEASVSAAIRKVERALSRKLGVAATLTDDQKQALRFITLEPGSIKPVQGYAGTGKTQLLEAARIAWKDSGYRVIGTTLSGKAAMGLESATAIKSFTVEKLLTSVNPSLKQLTTWQRTKLFGSELIRAAKANYYAERQASFFRARPIQALANSACKAVSDIAVRKPKKFVPPKLDSKTIVVVDEAAMLGTRAVLQIKRECDKAGAKLVLIGDRLQLPPIDAGGPFWSLAKRLNYASLKTIVRQEKAWMKDALTSIINGEPAEALELYAKNDSLQIEKTKKSAVDRLVTDYRKLKSIELPKALALVNTNEEAKEVNGRIQGRRKTAGELGWTSLKLHNGERVYKHDRVLFTLNSYQDGVRNGLLGTVVKVEPSVLRRGSVTIRLDDQQQSGFFGTRQQLVKIDLDRYKDIQLGYAVTTHKAQGTTVDRSFVLMGGAMLDKEMAFTQLSRARKQTKLYATELEAGPGLVELAKQMNKSRGKDLAHDHQLQRQQQLEHDRATELQRSLSMTG